MPPKIRELKAELQKAGFIYRPGKGSHTVWEYPDYPDITVTISGQNGDDAKPYQVKDVKNQLKRLKERKKQ